MKRPDKIIKQIHNNLADICRGTGALVIGLTGGIASGKSTVAEMFRDLGAVIIDFDLLARIVVEPGRQSWDLVTAFFGYDILNPDKTINRKKLSGIVFNDTYMREKLESFTHPFIWDEFLVQVKDSVRENREVIIIAVIPLLVEGSMHSLFLKNIVVYSPPEIQIQRLMARDEISRQIAGKMLTTQMPIDDKVQHGDFIIDNEGAPEDTRKEVRELWKKIKDLQKNRKA